MVLRVLEVYPLGVHQHSSFSCEWKSESQQSEGQPKNALKQRYGRICRVRKCSAVNLLAEVRLCTTGMVAFPVLEICSGKDLDGEAKSLESKVVKLH